MKFLNWLLYETHRWLGIALAIFMLAWFASGLVIMYAEPTTQSRSQQLAHTESLQPQSGWLSLGEVWQISEASRLANPGPKPPAAVVGNGADDAPLTLLDGRLLRIAGQPVWLVEDSSGRRYALSALDGSVLKTDPQQALVIALNWYQKEYGQIADRANYIETIDNPVILRNQDALKPFHLIGFDDQGLQLLISARTGEVMHASTEVSRLTYYAGNWLHLFKPLESLGWGGIRHDVQLWSGLTAAVASLTGLIIGWLRWRPGFRGGKTYSQGRTQPYREAWMVWHFWAGLLGGTLALLWAVSGYVSTNPGKIFSSPDLTKLETAQFMGGQIPEILFRWHPAADAQTLDDNLVELAWRRLGDEAVLLAYGRDGSRAPIEVGNAEFSQAAIIAATQRLIGPDNRLGSEILSDYDSYYYPRRHQGKVERPLPVIKLQTADQRDTWLYLDPVEGRVLTKLEPNRRVYRWLYSALHYWDFGWLNIRPLWDFWMLLLVGFGLVLSASSLVIGWRRLKRTFAPAKRLGKRSARPLIDAKQQPVLSLNDIR